MSVYNKEIGAVAPQRSIRHWVNFQIGNYLGIYRHLPAHQLASSRIGRENDGALACAERLPQTFIVTEDKHLLFLDWTSRRAAKLIAFERRNERQTVDRVKVEWITRIEGTVADEFVSGAMKRIGTGSRDRIDNSPRAAPIVCRGIARDDRELLDRVHTQVSAENASWCSVSVVVDAHAIHPIVILLWSVPSYGQLRSPPTVDSPWVRI